MSLFLASPAVVQFLARAAWERRQRLLEQAAQDGGGRLAPDVEQAVRILVDLAQTQQRQARESAKGVVSQARAESLAQQDEVGTEEAGRLLGVSEQRVGQLIAEGQLTSRRPWRRGPHRLLLTDVLDLKETRERLG